MRTFVMLIGLLAIKMAQKIHKLNRCVQEELQIELTGCYFATPAE